MIRNLRTRTDFLMIGLALVQAVLAVFQMIVADDWWEVLEAFNLLEWVVAYAIMVVTAATWRERFLGR